MSHVFNNQRIRVSVIAALFVAAQLTFGLAGGKVLAAESADHANEHAAVQVEDAGQPASNANENANEEHGPTNPVALDAIEQAIDNDSSNNPSEDNKPEVTLPTQAVDQLTEHANEHAIDNVVNNTPNDEAPVVQEVEVEVKITLCHATHSEGNPFESINIAVAAAYNGHLGDGNGDHQDGEDIIPPFDYKGQSYSQNWDAAGQATFNNGCVAPSDNEEPEEQPEQVKVTLCHATGSVINPFEKITVADDAAYHGHLGLDHQDGEDIIPPFDYKGQSYSQNWDAAGQATFNNGCVPPTGGQGGDEGDDGDVLGASTTSGGQVAGEQLVNTGSNMLMSIIVSLTILGLTAGAHLMTRKQYS